MARKKTRNKTNKFLAPINPGLHYVLFLVIGLGVLGVVTLFSLQAVKQTRAKFICPQANVDQQQLFRELSLRCLYGVEYTTDDNGCGVWICKTAQVEVE